MENSTEGLKAKIDEGRDASSNGSLVSRPALSQWITAHELQALDEALSRGSLPPDFLRKLNRLRNGDLTDHFIEQNCRLWATLLVAMEDGSFREGTRAERNRLLHVLAYIRKDDDAIPDYRPDGLTDDQQEMRAATVELGGLIQAFKTWRLRHQVPAMWSGTGARK
jgi:hypothetical protein